MGFGNPQTTSQQTGFQDTSQQQHMEQAQKAVANTDQNTHQETGQSSSQNTEQVTGGPNWLTNAAAGNLDYAQALLSKGFTPYSGQQVASFAPQQAQSFGLANQIAGGIAPYAGETGALVSNYANAGPQKVNVNSIASQMSPYMNQYVAQALAPQLAAYDIDTQNAMKGVNAAATSSGAFGDARAGIESANTDFLRSIGRQGLVGNAYTQAFNTAIGAGAQDVANQFNAGTTNANLAETALSRQLGGANAFNAFGTNAANLTNTMGAQQTGMSQAQLNAAYNQYLMAQQYPFLANSNMNAALAASRGAAPTTTTGATAGSSSGITNGSMDGGTTQTSTGITNQDMTGKGNVVGSTIQPNNSGFGILGSVLGGAAMGLFSDPRLKENSEQVGELYDGTPVHKFNFKGDPRPLIGLMAPEVARRAPEAVSKDAATGFAKVDYGRATRRAAGLAAQLAIAA